MNKKLQIPLWVWKTMKISSLQLALIALYCGIAHAHRTNGQNVLERNISLQANDLRLMKVLSLIEEQASVRFVYSPSAIDIRQRVTMKVTNRKLESVLTEFLSPLSVGFTVAGDRILLKRAMPQPPGMNAREPDSSVLPEDDADRRISGKVTDEKGEALPGVSILLKGTQQGTTTNAEGAFSLGVPDDKAVLVFSFVGYTSEEVIVGSRTSVEVSLKVDQKSLEEVVVVGYGTQKKTSLTAAVSNMKGDEIASVPTTNLSNNLGGRLSGVIVKQGSGEPGKDGSSIFIRGISTTGSSSPLLIVDGIPRNFQQLDPNSIETFTVLKDAAAVAPYGVAGANGVVLVTTKKGQTGKPTITYNGYVGFQNPTVLPNYVSPSQFATLKNIIAESEGLPNPYTEEEIRKYGDGSDPEGYPSEKILDIITNRNARLVYHNFEVSGGTEKIGYYSGVGYQYQEGSMWDNSNAKRFNLIMNVDAKVTNSTTITLKLNGILNNTKQPPTDQPNNSSARMMEAVGYAHVGSGGFGGPAVLSNGMFGYAVMGDIYGSGYRKGNENRIYSQLNIEQSIPAISGLKLKGTIAYDPSFGASKTWATPVRLGTVNKNVTPYTIGETFLGNPKPSLTEEWHRRNQMTYQAGLDYNISFGSNSLSVVGVFEAKSNYSASIVTSRRNYNLYIDEIDMGSSSNSDMGTGGTSSDARQVGLAYRIAYERGGKYMFEASGRYDGHYYFAPENRFGFFPSLSAGWRISEENFIKSNIRWLSNLKLRASHGEVGALAGSPFQYLSTYNVAGPGYKLGGNAVQIVSERAEPNFNITWERAKKTDIGLELGVLNNQVNIEIDYFYEKRSNMLVAPDVITPQEYGIGLSQVNAGIMENRGIDLTAGLNYRVNRDLLIQFNGTLTYARNKLLQTFENTVTYNNPNRRRTGRPLGTQFGFDALGFFQPEDFENNGTLKPGIATQPWGAVRPGDIRYKDINGDGRIDVNDEVAIGDPNQSPRIIYGLSPNIRFKNWSLDILFQGAAKTHLYHIAEMSWAFFNGMNAYVDNFNYWRPDNRDAKHPRLTGSPTTNNTRESSFWMKNAAYLRLKNATLSYRIPESIAGKIGIHNARIYASGQNILTWTPMIYWDPESTMRSYPQQKVVSLGISLSL